MDLYGEIRKVRGTVRHSRALESAARWAFYATAGLCAIVAVVKILGGSPGILWIVPAVLVPVAAAFHAVTRPFTVYDCAVLVDRTFGLEERVSTWLEARGGRMEGVLGREATRAWTGVEVERLIRGRVGSWGILWCGSALLALGLFWTPHRLPESAPSGEWEAHVRSLAVRLRTFTVKQDSSEVRSLARDLARVANQLIRDPKGALSRLEEIEERSRRLAAKGGKEAVVLREIAEQAAGSGAALAAGLRRQGSSVVYQTPRIVLEKFDFSRHGLDPYRGGSRRPGALPQAVFESWGPAGVMVREAMMQAYARRDWDARYDSIVKRYFEGE